MSSSSSLPEADALLTEASEPILTESEGMLQIEVSSSSSLTGNVFLDNIDLFRQYSLDADLIELYFNKGVFVDEVNLDDGLVENSSSSSSQGFRLKIELKPALRDLLGASYLFPDDLQFYFYDETINGAEYPGLFQAEKAPGSNFVFVTMSASLEEGDECSFQINIEHPDLRTKPVRFTFRNELQYAQSLEIPPRTMNEERRLEHSYISYLAGWIGDFWAAYDNQETSLAAPTRPPSNANSEFDPFAHARWKILSESLTQAGMRSLNALELSPGNKGLIDPWNFLGVPANIFECISRDLYRSRWDDAKSPEEWIAGQIDQTFDFDTSFDCRSFAAAAAYFLRSQLQSQCPQSEVYLQRTGHDGNSHALIYVKLIGENECCTGSFIYEPQNGALYDRLRKDNPGDSPGYCDDYPQRCLDENYWETKAIGQEHLSPTFNNPNWENFPEEQERITNVVCGCLSGDYKAGSTEAMIKSKCGDGTFWDWFKESYSFDPGKVSTPMTDMPQILSCKKNVCLAFPDPGEPPCAEFDEGEIPYLCALNCIERWICLDSAESGPTCRPIFSWNGVNGEYDNEEQCLDYCSSDKACVYEWVLKYNCTSEQWTRVYGGNSLTQCMSRSRAQSSDNWEVGASYVPESDPERCLYRSFRLVSEGACDGECPETSYDDPSAPDAVKYEPPPPSDCCGSWCVFNPENTTLTGECASGTLKDWTDADNRNEAQNFQVNKSCSELDCSNCPDGYRKIDWSSGPPPGFPFIAQQEFLCVPDCMHADHRCDEGFCCVESDPINPHGTNSCVFCPAGCCEPDLLGGERCVDCPDKTKTLRFWGQNSDLGTSPWG